LDEESVKYAAAREASDFDIAAVIAGEAVGLIHDIPWAHDVIERVVHEAFGTAYPVVVIGCRSDQQTNFGLVDRKPKSPTRDVSLLPSIWLTGRPKQTFIFW
jgi:hypothetical protein